MWVLDEVGISRGLGRVGSGFEKGKEVSLKVTPHDI